MAALVDLAVFQIHGDALAPHLAHLDFALCDPTSDVAPGDLVMVILRSGPAYGKRLVAVTDDEIVLETVTPPVRETVRRADVVAVLLIVGRGRSIVFEQDPASGPTQ